jgi:hypothetical protein
MDLSGVGDSWKQAFMDIMLNEANNAAFNLQNISNIWESIRRGLEANAGLTDYELAQIYQHPEWWSRITWFTYNNGVCQSVENPFH